MDCRLLVIITLGFILLFAGVPLAAQGDVQIRYKAFTPGDTLNLRTSPRASGEANVAARVESGTELIGTGKTVGQGRNVWVEVSYEGRLLWARRTLLQQVAAIEGEAKRSPAYRPHNPIVRLGKPGWKNLIVFFWSPTRQSAEAYSDVIRPLWPDVERGALNILLYQIASDDPTKIAAETAFLCGDVAQYGELVARYLSYLKQGLISDTDVITGLSTVRTDAMKKLPRNLKDCAAGQAGAERKAMLEAYRDAAKEYVARGTPVILLNGKIMENQANDMRNAFLK